MEISLYRTVCCGSSGVLIMEVSLYTTVCCGSSGVLIMEVSLYMTVTEALVVSYFTEDYVA